MRKTAIAILTLTTCYAATAAAADQMKPGLWEMTMKSDAMKGMPQISAEQREQMRKMGITLPQMQDGAMVHKICLTKEMVERNQMPSSAERESGCQSKNMQRSGSSYSMDIICDGPTLKGQGKVQGRHSGNEQFHSTYDFKGTMQGQQTIQHSESSGKWLSADCGNIKPHALAGTKK